MSSPLVEQFRKGGASRQIRLTAAAGLLPLKPADQLELLCLLSLDRDPEVSQKADATLSGLPVEELQGVFSDRTTSPEVLGLFGARLKSPGLLQVIIQNPSTEDEVFLTIIPRLSTDLLELVVINQTRLLRHPPIIDALESNPQLSSDQRRRLNELKHDFKLGEKPPPVEAAPTRKPEVLVDLEQGPPEDEAPPPMSVEDAEAAWGDGRGDEALSEEERTTRRSLIKDLLTKPPSKKVIAALKGDREVRMLLVRDRNRMVYSAVLSSPRLTDGDVDTIASLRNISPEVLRVLGGKKEWTKRYKVKHELVKNPLTPTEVSMQLIAQLSTMDLKRLANDRNVPEQVRRQASKLTRVTR